MAKQSLTHLVTAALLCLPSIALAQEWSKGRVVVKPGLSVGPVKVGEKLSEEAKKYLGPPTKVQANAEGTPGYTLFGKGDSRDLSRGLRLRQSDPKSPDKVVAIEVKGLRASTEEGVFLGASSGLIPSKYPSAQKDSNPFTGAPEWTIPGLTMRLKGDKISEFLIEPAINHAWRFSELRVIPGQSVGAIVIGKPVPSEVMQQFGEPTIQVAPTTLANSGMLRWSLPGRNPDRFLEVLLHDGSRPRVVTQIRLRGVQAITDRQVRLGESQQAVTRLYHEGRSGISAQVGSETWRVPGLTFVFQNGKISELQVFKQSSGRSPRGR